MADQEAERRAVKIHVHYIEEKPNRPQLRIYTSSALDQVAQETLEVWNDKGETVYEAELWRVREFQKFPAGFCFRHAIAGGPDINALADRLVAMYGARFDEFLKWCWARTQPGLPAAGDFPLCFPPEATGSPT